MIRNRQHGAALPSLPPDAYDQVVREALSKHLEGEAFGEALSIWRQFHVHHASFSFRQLCRRITASLRLPALTDTLYVSMLQGYFQRRQKLLTVEPGLRGLTPEAGSGDAAAQPATRPAALGVEHRLFARLIQNLLYSVENRVPLGEHPARSVDTLLMKALRRCCDTAPQRVAWFGWLRRDVRPDGDLPALPQAREILAAILVEANTVVNRLDVETALALAVSGTNRLPEAREFSVHLFLTKG